jgi:glycine C-acetyltransferase
MGQAAGARHEYHGVVERIDILTGTLGKALGGAVRRVHLRPAVHHRPAPPAVAALSVFSNSLPPAIAGATLKSLELLAGSTQWRDQLEHNARWFREAITEAGFNIVPGEHPIVPIMIGDAVEAGRMAERLLDEGIYVVAFSYPVVPQGKARIRVQLSAAHTQEDLERAVAAFKRAKAD